jgi:hypothetical protein
MSTVCRQPVKVCFCTLTHSGAMHRKRPRLLGERPGAEGLTTCEMLQRLLTTGGVSNTGLGQLLALIKEVYPGVDLPTSHGSMSAASLQRLTLSTAVPEIENLAVVRCCFNGFSVPAA